MMRIRNEKLFFTNSEKEFILGEDYQLSKLVLLEIIEMSLNY